MPDNIKEFAVASSKWMNSASQTVFGVDLNGARKATLMDSSGNEMFTSASSTFMRITDGTNVANVMQANGEMGLVTVTPGHVCTDNSTSTILGISGVFTGVAADVVNHGVIVVMVKASHASATNGLSVQFSADGTNWDSTDEYTIAANTGKTFTFQTSGKYYRIVYTNGVVAQTYFRLQSVLKPYYIKPSSHRVGDVISSEDDAELMKAVLTAKYNGTFTPINASQSGNLQITDAENGLAIAKGDVIGTSFIHKFGNAPNFDYTDGTVTIWDGAEDGELWENMVYDYSVTADIDSISSSNVSDTVTVTVIGLDTNYSEVSQTVTLNGQTRVALTTSLIRAYRAYNASGTDLVGHVVVYVNTALTTGVPTDKSKIRAIIDPLNQQTEMCVYTVPSGYTGYMRSWYAGTVGAKKDTTNYVIKLKSREFGKVFRIKHISSVSDVGTSSLKHPYEEPEIFPEKTDIEMTATITESGIIEASIVAGFDIVLVAN